MWLLTLLLLALAAGAAAQPPNPPAPVPAPGPAPATICSTAWGWCPLPTLTMAPGQPCYCFVPPGSWLPGEARYWPYTGPVSPYLNPHVAPPSTIP
ncbi:MAG TPA: hypothetical protein VFX28_00635 [Methylomirabilota bacterium]|nr:hypothetical protein [Methylomirabilota bacterium]